jgi:hypothetical protein
LATGKFASFKACATQFSYLSSFIFFAVLATLGDCLALRINTGSYYRKGFGVVCRALAWGVIGLLVYIAFTVFAGGAWPLLQTFGCTTPPEGFGWASVLAAFTTSVTINLFCAPLLMILHKLSENRIETTGGSLFRYLTARLDVARSFREIDWSVMWGVVFKKTIPLFWIPAHIITFLLPTYWRVPFAALLIVALGVILSLAGRACREKASSAVS